MWIMGRCVLTFEKFSRENRDYGCGRFSRKNYLMFIFLDVFCHLSYEFSTREKEIMDAGDGWMCACEVKESPLCLWHLEQQDHLPGNSQFTVPFTVLYLQYHFYSTTLTVPHLHLPFTVPNLQYHTYSTIFSTTLTVPFTVPHLQCHIFSTKFTVPHLQYRIYSTTFSLPYLKYHIYSTTFTVSHSTTITVPHWHARSSARQQLIYSILYSTTVQS